MEVFAIILFTVAVPAFFIGLAVFRGRTDLIHDYHQKNVNEESRLKYGRAVGCGLFVMSVSMAVSGIVSFFCNFLGLILGILFVGLAVGIVLLIRAQKKYNGGIML